MQEIIHRIRTELEGAASEETRRSGERFFKEAVQLHGVKSAQVEKIAKAGYQEIRDLAKSEIWTFCEALWQEGHLEETFIACNWSYARHKEYAPEDFALFTRWVERYVTNWASCDTLCNHTIGAFIERYPEYLAQLKTWAGSPNLWVRRAAAVSLIIPARRGKFLADILAIADLLLLDQEDLVQKGYGWMLKAASEAHQPEVFQFVLERKAVMPRTALRYAIEKMPQEMRQRAMARD